MANSQQTIGIYLVAVTLIVLLSADPYALLAQSIATTTATVSNCGDELITPPEECDVIGETGVYSTTIAGRQCNEECEFGPYCGDGVLQTIYDEECDDGNNDSLDFCSATCQIEPSGSGGGGSSGGGGRSAGGSDTELGDTIVAIEGFAYPNRTINIVLDGDSVGTVRSASDGSFDFSVDANPGAATLGLWTTDAFGTRSATLTLTFDVTQGAVTNLRGVYMPPTLRVNDTTINSGDILTISGQASPNKQVKIYLGNDVIAETTSNTQGDWSIAYDSTGLANKEYALKARMTTGTTGSNRESSFSTAVQLFVGVEGRAATPSDLNRDGKINLIDFSILIFWWGTAGGNSDPAADISGNGRVSLEDFSILLFNWTG